MRPNSPTVDNTTLSVNLGTLPQLQVAVVTDGQLTDNAQPQPPYLSPQNNQPPIPQNHPPQLQAEESDSEEMEAGPSGISPPNFKGNAPVTSENRLLCYAYIDVGHKVSSQSVSTEQAYLVWVGLSYIGDHHYRSGIDLP